MEGKLLQKVHLKMFLNSKKSLTGAYLSGRKSIPTPKERRSSVKKSLILNNCVKNNLKDISVEFPLGRLVSVTGVSGSGKSTLVNELLHPALSHSLGLKVPFPKGVKELKGIKAIDKVIVIDQSPIGRTPRSNPVTYTGIFTPIRELFSETEEARARGYKPGRFSFNVKGGRCENCQGDGLIKVEMHFLPDVYVKCDVCDGKRYNKETLEVKFKGKNIFEVLDMNVEESLKFF